jgi:hypothetical protein
MTLAHDANPLDATRNLNAAVTAADRRTLDAIYRHPLSHNLSWREVVSLIAAIGDAEEKVNGEVVFRVGDARVSITRPHAKDLLAADVIDLRHFLTRAGWSPEAIIPSEPAADPEPQAPSLVVVVDHAGAKVYRIDSDADPAHAASASDPRHLLHHVERSQRDADRDETYPVDDHVFEQVAATVASGGPIVVIGHGKGQSNEAAHLTAYLKRHHHDIYLRIAKEIAADLPSLTTPELLQLGRHALLTV